MHDDLIQRLDKIAKATGNSRGELIESLLVQALAVTKN
jgi:metal-responsive CopG/Arc/MetJ family transcriptional regulator